MISIEQAVILRGRFIRFWQILCLLLAVAVAALYALCLFSGRGMSSGEVGGLALWTWVGGMIGVVFYSALFLYALGQEPDSLYMKSNHPELWKKIFPSRYFFHSAFLLAFCMGGLGDKTDHLLRELRLRWRRELYVLSLPFLLSICIFSTFSLWRMLGMLHVKP